MTNDDLHPLKTHFNDFLLLFLTIMAVKEAAAAEAQKKESHNDSLKMSRLCQLFTRRQTHCIMLLFLF